MANSIKLDQMRPLLKKCSLYEGDKNVVIEDDETKAQIVLPKENQRILELLDGEHSIKEISSELYNSHGQVSFHSIITTVKLLNEAHLLEGVDDQFKDLPEDKSPHEQKVSILNRPLFEIKLLKRVKINFESSWLFYCLALAMVGVFGFGAKNYLDLNLESFLKSGNDYHESLFRIFFISSALITIKSLFQASLLIVSTGNFYGPFLRVFPYALGLGINDNSLYSHSRRSVIISYGVLSGLLYGVAFSALSFIPEIKPYLNDIAIISIVLTFIEMNPYRRSDMTKLFYFFYAENQLKNIMPYLKNCSLSGIWKDSGAKISDEIRYVTYSVLSIVWAIGFTLFSFDMILKAVPGLFYEVQLGQDLSKYSSMAVLSMLFFITGYLLVDLFHTVFKNILSPMLVPLMKLRKSAKTYKAQDLSMDEIRQNLKQNMLFNQFSEEAIDFMMLNASVKTMKKDQTLIMQGDDGRNVYFLVRGEVDVSVRQNTGRTKHIVSLGHNTIIGEMAILSHKKRTANVTAASDIVYLEFDEKVFSEFMNLPEFEEDFTKLKNRIEISQFVSTANMFKDFPPEVMNLFVEAGDLVIFPEGSNVVDEGETDKTFYLLIRGKVEISKHGEVLTELGQGEFFGEVALIANVPRTATVKTLEESLFLYIEDKKFWKILSENIELAMYIESVGRHRMLDTASDEVKAA